MKFLHTSTYIRRVFAIYSLKLLPLVSWTGEWAYVTERRPVFHKSKILSSVLSIPRTGTFTRPTATKPRCDPRRTVRARLRAVRRLFAFDARGGS